jgi:2-polyprenyl-3-methyl-5-hydroxy-6-metoxy-1,4-benzoquinol methylase
MTENLEKYDLFWVEWAEPRCQMIVNYYGPEYFKNKTLLETAAAWGHIGNFFSELGAKVLCTDYSDANLKIINEKFPHLKTENQNLNTPWTLNKTFDIIIHMGVFYHQTKENAERTLREVCKRGRDIIFETSVNHEDDNTLAIPDKAPPKEDLWEPDIESPSARNIPSVAYIERILTEEGKRFMREDYRENRALWFIEPL